jgi:hypothetical protein
MYQVNWILFVTITSAILLNASDRCRAQDEPPFSGPQPGEALSPFEVQDLLAEDEKRIQPIKTADGKPCLIIFIHTLSRPAIGLTRTLATAAEKLDDDKPTVSIIFLTDDPNETQQWAKRARNALPQGVQMGVSTEGVEGPGAYGLNRKVAMTILVGKENKVTANFALVQPSMQADAPKVISALAQCMGVPVPENLQKELGAAMTRVRPPARPESNVDDGELRRLLSPVINKEATQEGVAEAAKRVEEAVAKSAPLKKRIGDICRRIIDADRLSNYGNEHTQAVLSRWAKEFN